MNQFPSDIDTKTRNLAQLCHAIALIGCFLPFLGHMAGPLLVWLILRDRDPFIDEHGKESLNFQISLTAYSALLCLPLLITSTGIILIPILFVLFLVYILNLVGVVIASNSAREGRLLVYPLIFRLIR